MSSTITIDDTKKQIESKNDFKIQPPYNVILLNDDDHSVIYVIYMMKKIFGYNDEKGLKIAEEVHKRGRCIVWTGSKELAELKQEQIHEFGPDLAIINCKGSMTCVIEPAM